MKNISQSHIVLLCTYSFQVIIIQILIDFHIVISHNRIQETKRKKHFIYVSIILCALTNCIHIADWILVSHQINHQVCPSQCKQTVVIFLLWHFVLPGFMFFLIHHGCNSIQGVVRGLWRWVFLHHRWHLVAKVFITTRLLQQNWTTLFKCFI